MEFVLEDGEVDCLRFGSPGGDEQEMSDSDSSPICSVGLKKTGSESQLNLGSGMSNSTSIVLPSSALTSCEATALSESS